MSVNTVVAILIAVSEASSPATASMTAAVTEALGPEASVVLRTTSATSDGEALATERELHADGVAHVVWEGADQTVGVLRAHVRSTDRWFERRVTFSPSDSRVERGRTLGFAFASLLLAGGSATADAPADEDRSVALATVAPAPAAVAASVAASPAPIAPPSVERPRQRGLTLELAAQAVRGIGGPAESLGGTLHAEIPLRGPFHARAGGGLRAGHVEQLDGNLTVAAASGGLAFRPLVPAPGRSALGLGITLEGAALYQDLSHQTSGGETLHQGHWFGGMTGGVDGSWAVVRSLDLWLGLGAEVAFGTTAVTVAGRDIGTVPAFRLTAQAGIRWHY